jgi:putative ABC transport system permease protein
MIQRLANAPAAPSVCATATLKAMSDTKTIFMDAWRGLTLARVQRAMRLGIRSLWLHRLRSLLTVLGIVFGVCSVIAMLAIGEGASYEAQEQIKSLGSQNIIIRSSKPPDEQKATQGSQSYVLNYGVTYADAERITATIPGVTVILPARNIRDYVWNISRRVDCEIVGTVPWYPTMRNHRVSSGRFFTDKDMDARTSVCVLGAEMVPLLFPMESPLGKHVRVGGDYYQVIGIMEARGHDTKADDGTESKDKSAAYRMFVPLATVKMRYGEILMRQRAGSFEAERVELHELTVKVASLEEVTGVAEAIKAVMERNHKKKDYQIDVPLEMLRRAERTKQIFNIVLGSIAAISLLVGGIGIMNIMLASVTERTREIGIRRALGARRRDIIVQFLVETVMLSGIGGIMGVLLGVTIPFIVSHTAGMKTIITLWSPLLAFTISALVGVVFGIYPAIRAANMDPVEALRHE